MSCNVIIVVYIHVIPSAVNVFEVYITIPGIQFLPHIRTLVLATFPAPALLALCNMKQGPENVVSHPESMG